MDVLNLIIIIIIKYIDRNKHNLYKNLGFHTLGVRGYYKKK